MNESTSTTHDPMCDWLQTICTTATCPGLRMGDHCEHEWCQCELIAKVRADEKAKWTHTCDGNNCCHQPGE